MSRNWLFYIEDIVESARKIRRYTEGITFEQFRTQDLIIDALLTLWSVTWKSSGKPPNICLRKSKLSRPMRIGPRRPDSAT